MTETPDLFSVARQADQQREKHPTNAPELSVSDLAFSLKKTLEDAYGRVRVRGEFSRVKVHTSGHLYTDLKDDKAVINAICWRGTLQKLSIMPEEGMEVICTGRISTYPQRSNYQLIIESVELAGEGALLKLLEMRKKTLAAEGIFDSLHKKNLPFLPDRIGVITSQTGAVLHDICTTLARRFPRQVMLWPVPVQGQGASEKIAAAITGMNALPDGIRPDVVIVARGGGSLEDLMPFQEEEVVRAVAGSILPIISAVGHETDTTLIDLAADRRAATPTAAAEMAVPERAILYQTLESWHQSLFSNIQKMLRDRSEKLRSLSSRLKTKQNFLDIFEQNFGYASDRLENVLVYYVERLEARFSHLSSSLRQPDLILQHKSARLDKIVQSLKSNIISLVSRYENKYQRAAQDLKLPRYMLDNRYKNVQQIANRLPDLIIRYLEQKDKNLETQSRVLESVSYRNVLKRGYAVIRGDEGQIVTCGSSFKEGQNIQIDFYDQYGIPAKIAPRDK